MGLQERPCEQAMTFTGAKEAPASPGCQQGPPWLQSPQSGESTSTAQPFFSWCHPCLVPQGGSFWHVNFSRVLLKISSNFFMFCKPLCFQVSWDSWGETSPWSPHCCCWVFQPLLVRRVWVVVKSTLGIVCRRTWGRKYVVRPEAPFLHGSVRCCMAEAACCPHVSFKPAHLENGTETKGVTFTSPLGFPS